MRYSYSTNVGFQLRSIMKKVFYIRLPYHDLLKHNTKEVTTKDVTFSMKLLDSFDLNILNNFKT